MARVLAGGCLFLAGGCGTTRQTDTVRSATEMLLVSKAIDESISQLDFTCLAGKKVFFDAQYLDGAVDKGYCISSLRQLLLGSGCLLQEDRAKATYVVEARAGSLGTNHNSLLVGVPQMTLPSVVPGMPSVIPEIPFAKKTDQQGVAKIAVFAYNRETGRAFWQSGVLESSSNERNTWLLGTGPFRRGSILKKAEFAGQEIPVSVLANTDEHDHPINGPVPVTSAMIWIEGPSRPAMGTEDGMPAKPVSPASDVKLATYKEMSP